MATCHAYDDFELRPEDHAVLKVVADVRRSYLHCSAAPGVTLDDEYLLADIDSRLSSLEARAEILRLATS